MSFFGSLLLKSGVEKNHVEITEKNWKPNNNGEMPKIFEVL